MSSKDSIMKSQTYQSSDNSKTSVGVTLTSEFEPIGLEITIFVASVPCNFLALAHEAFIWIELPGPKKMSSHWWKLNTCRELYDTGFRAAYTLLSVLDRRNESKNTTCHSYAVGTHEKIEWKDVE